MKLEISKEEEAAVKAQLICLADGCRGSEGTMHLSQLHFMFLGAEAVPDGGEYEVKCEEFVAAVDMLTGHDEQPTNKRRKSKEEPKKE